MGGRESERNLLTVAARSIYGRKELVAAVLRRGRGLGEWGAALGEFVGMTHMDQLVSAPCSALPDALMISCSYIAQLVPVEGVAPAAELVPPLMGELQSSCSR